MKIVILMFFCLLIVSNTVLAQTNTLLDNGDGTITDVATALIWQKEDDNVVRDFSASNQYCQSLILAGNSNWRLPDVKEFTSIIRFSGNIQRNINRIAFPATSGSFAYWTSTTTSNSSSQAWEVYFSTDLVLSTGSIGNVDQRSKTGQNFVRCVR